MLGYRPKDRHQTESFDFLCEVSGAELFVEVKGTQDDRARVSSTPKEVGHIQMHRNSALFIVHSIKVEGKRNPLASGAKELFVFPWSLEAGTLKPRGFVYSLSEEQRRAASTP